MTLNQTAVDAHHQLYPVSCIPMAVELVLKLLGKVPMDYYLLQEDWRNRTDGSFGAFDGRTIAGITFRAQFPNPRGPEFPMARLFETIDAELASNRFVVISLAVPGGWHMYVIYQKSLDGDFQGVSKQMNITEQKSGIKSQIIRMGGTDILTYEVQTAT
jgi:hypothetical protein